LKFANYEAIPSSVEYNLVATSKNSSIILFHILQN
jgi:hypothetical protein